MFRKSILELACFPLLFPGSGLLAESECQPFRQNGIMLVDDSGAQSEGHFNVTHIKRPLFRRRVCRSLSPLSVAQDHLKENAFSPFEEDIDFSRGFDIKGEFTTWRGDVALIHITATRTLDNMLIVEDVEFVNVKFLDGSSRLIISDSVLIIWGQWRTEKNVRVAMTYLETKAPAGARFVVIEYGNTGIRSDIIGVPIRK